MMIKPASGMCNLRCKYCFYHDVAEHRSVPNTGCMAQQTAHRLIDQALAFAGGEQIAFAFQGGEPLLAGREYFRDFVGYVRRQNKKKSPVFFSLQTNGILVDDEWADFFHQNHFLIGLSLDGDRAGNKFRVGPDGGNSFDSILTAAHMLEKHQVDFNILTVVTGYTARNINRIYDFFKKQGFRYLRFIRAIFTVWMSGGSAISIQTVWKIWRIPTGPLRSSGRVLPSRKNAVAASFPGYAARRAVRETERTATIVRRTWAFSPSACRCSGYL